MNEGVMKNSCSKGSPRVVEKQRKRLNQRQKARILLIFSVAFLAVTAILGVVLHDAAMVTDFSRKNIAPCLKYPFGTDWLGRNMFYRTLTGLSMSILIGVLAAGVSAVMALILGICAATLGKKVDSAISFAYSAVDPDFLCYGKRAEGSDCRCGADALDISGKADSRRGYAASGK